MGNLAGITTVAHDHELPQAIYRENFEDALVSNRLLRRFACSLILAFAGCAQKPKDAAPSPPPAIPVSGVVEREITDYVDFTGRTEAIQRAVVSASR
jgi:multidrug efflux pump subunit AcrA (membrane-fusion protein)